MTPFIPNGPAWSSEYRVWKLSRWQLEVCKVQHRHAGSQQVQHLHTLGDPRHFWEELCIFRSSKKHNLGVGRNQDSQSCKLQQSQTPAEHVALDLLSCMQEGECSHGYAFVPAFSAGDVEAAHEELLDHLVAPFCLT